VLNKRHGPGLTWIFNGTKEPLRWQREYCRRAAHSRLVLHRQLATPPRPLRLEPLCAVCLEAGHVKGEIFTIVR
jgi:hypothetical protein